LNPAFQEAHPSKATAAGVCSTATQMDGLWISKPGYLPLAHRGVFAIQDFHSVKDAQREKLLGIFNMVMEDGRVIDSTAARQTHAALTSIHLDTNKRTDLFPDSQLRGDTIIAKRLDDIRIPMTILSRFDFIIDIPRDAERQMEVSLAMYDRSGNVQAPRSPAQQRASWSRKLQVLVALLRTEHGEIRFPKPIRRYMRGTQADSWRKSGDALQKIPWLSDFQARLTNSFFKFVAAIARMHGRDKPVVPDVDHAFRLIRRKFEFVATLAKHLNLAKTWEAPEGPDLEQWLLNRFAGQTCTTGDILRAYEDSFGLPPVRRTIERHVPQVAQRRRKGLWEFPPPMRISARASTTEGRSCGKRTE
jgi:DNA replicative helicase MCM subunit Mcm2 (Cdc46/Mcm family)